MKIKTPFFYLEAEYLFLIFSFICLFSNKMRSYFAPFYLCYLFISFHELSHIFVASLFGKKLDTIKLTLSGVNAKFEKSKYVLNEETSYLHNIFIYLAGPMSNIILAVIFHDQRYIFDINISLAIINMLFIYPLDGYNILLDVFGDFKYRKKYLNIIEKVFLLVLIFFSFIQILYSKNISISIFTVYILLIRSKEKINISKEKYDVKKMFHLNDKNITIFK